PVRRVVVEPVRGDPRREHRQHCEEQHRDRAGGQHAHLDAARLAQRRPGPDQRPVLLRRAAAGDRPSGSGPHDQVGAHWYLTLGSISAVMTSIRKLATTTTTAITVTMPCTATKSRLVR